MSKGDRKGVVGREGVKEGGDGRRRDKGREGRTGDGGIKGWGKGERGRLHYRAC